MPKARRRTQVAASTSLIIEIIRILISQGYLDFHSLVAIYQSHKGLHAFFYNFYIRFEQRIGDEIPPFYISDTWKVCFDAFTSIYWSKAYYNPSYNVAVELPNALLANGHYDLACRLIEHSQLDKSSFSRGIAGNGQMHIFEKFTESMKPSQRQFFASMIRMNSTIAPKFSTSILEQLGCWTEERNNIQSFRYMIDRRCKRGLEWIIKNVFIHYPYTYERYKSNMVFYCKLKWNELPIEEILDRCSRSK